MHIKGLYIGFLLFAWACFSQQVQEEQEPPPNIKTIIFNTEANPYCFPIIALGEGFTLKFDDLDASESDYYYEIVHCNYDWVPSPVPKINYMQGYDNQRIMSYTNAVNTLQNYSSYTLQIPNQFTKRLNYTGNYILRILKDGELVFSRRFIIASDDVAIIPKVQRTREIEELEKKQVIQFEVRNTGGLSNLQQFIKVAVFKNATWASLKADIQPQYVLGDRLVYAGNNEISFFAGNEFLQFDNKNIRGGNIYIRTTKLEDIYYNYLYIDEDRSRKTYTYFPDINGGFVVRNLDSQQENTDADYAWINFELNAANIADSSKVYVLGRFNNYNLSEENRLAYDEDSQTYKGKLLIKQGFYNYDYAVQNQSGLVDYGAISGNFWQTENTYQILVYYRDFTQNYDRVIGKAEVSSLNLGN